jgi:GntR family transcriptional regulator
MLCLCTLGVSPIYLKIDHNAGIPISAQMLEQIKYQVISGALEPGTKVPSVRALAADLKLNPTTVARVYQQLETEGVFHTQRGRGTFIAARRAAYTGEEQRRRIAPLIRHLVVEAGQLGLDYEELIALIEAEIASITPG